MKIFIKQILIFIFSFLILDACTYFKANSTFLKNISGDKYLYLRYVPIVDRFSKVQNFYLDLVPRKDNLDSTPATNFTIELVEMRDEKGKKIEKTLFNSLGCYMLANIKTPDGKYLVFFYPSEITPYTFNNGLHLQAVDKLPSEMNRGYSWMVFHHYQLDEYFFQPMLNDFWYLQRMQHKAADSRPWVDVLPYAGDSESTGRYFIFWKLEDK